MAKETQGRNPNLAASEGSSYSRTVIQEMIGTIPPLSGTSTNAKVSRVTPMIKFLKEIVDAQRIHAEVHKKIEPPVQKQAQIMDVLRELRKVHEEQGKILQKLTEIVQCQEDFKPPSTHSSILHMQHVPIPVQQQKQSICGYCKKIGHKWTECRKRKRECFYCGSMEHSLCDCPQKKDL